MSGGQGYGINLRRHKKNMRKQGALISAKDEAWSMGFHRGLDEMKNNNPFAEGKRHDAYEAGYKEGAKI